MHVNARPASSHFEAEIHIYSDDRRLTQQRQLRHSSNGTEPRRWISESEWTNCIVVDPHVPLGPRSAVSIFLVPEFLKRTKREAYVPQRVSLGPYHHGSAELPPMGHQKGRALRTMMTRFNGNENIPVVLNSMDFADRARAEIRELEIKIRRSYYEIIDCDGQTLARMLSLDGCFLLEVLRTLSADIRPGPEAWEWYSPFNRENATEENGIVFAASDIVNDILMLENQVPFIVLQKLLQLELNSVDDVPVEFLNMLIRCIGCLLKPCDTLDIEQWCRQKLAGEKEAHHLLDFLYEAIVFLDFHPNQDMHQERWNEAQADVQRIRPAVELRNAGIKFKPCHGGIKKIKFDRENATIFLPPILITDITEIVLRNLVALEMCKPSQINYVISYVNLMDDLIDSPKDVALLIRMGVLTNRVGRDKEVVDLFKGLRKAAPVNLLDAFDQLTKRVNDHYEKQIRVQLQFPELVQDYFSSPWKALASAAAIVLLLFTLLQTIFSIISVYKK